MKNIARSVRVALLLAFAFTIVVAPACKTTGTPEPGGVGSAVVNCAVKATHEAGLHLVDDVSTALVSGNWQAALADLVIRWGQEAVACGVAAVTGTAQHNFQASGDATERLKAERGRQYLADHPVTL